MFSKGNQNGIKIFTLKKKINPKNIFTISKSKKSNSNILNFNKNIAPTHKKNPTYVINSSNSLIEEDKNSKDMMIDSAEKKSSNKTLNYKRKTSLVIIDTSYGDNYSTANSVTEIGKKNEIKPLLSKAEYKENDKKTENNNPLETFKDCAEDSIVSFKNEYIDEILENLKNEEINNEYKINPNYYKFQTEINSKMRIILIDWLFEVNCKLKFKEETFFTTVYIIDSYLSQKFVPRKKYQLLSVAALFIATKLNEIFTGRVKDYAFITDNAYKESEIIEMEEDICKVLKFNFIIPNCLSFFQIISNKIGIDKDVIKYNFGKFIIQCFLMSSKSLIYNYSTISAATSYLIMKLFNNDKNLNLIYFCLYCVDKYNIIEECYKNIWNVFKELLGSNLNISVKKYYKDNFDDNITKYISVYKE